MKILITGGSGFIGTHLVKKLMDNGEYAPIIFDKTLSTTFPDITVVGDVRDKNQLEQALNSVDLVIHLAAEHKDNVTPKTLYHDVNVGGTQNLIEACEKNNVNRIIFTSSVAVYGLDVNESHEESPLNPFNEYGQSKLHAEQIFLEWYKSQPYRSLTVIRPTVVFGEENRGNVHNLMRQVAENKFIMVGKGQNKKSMAYVGNLVNFIVSILEKNGLTVVNYADKPDLSTAELISLIDKILNRESNRFSIPYWLGICAGYFFDLCAKMLGKEFSISSVRIRKFCSNSTINTTVMSKLQNDDLIPLPEAIERTVRYEFINRVEF